MQRKRVLFLFQAGGLDFYEILQPGRVMKKT